MSKDFQQQPKPSEEADLGQLFNAIGNMFEKMFRFIGGLFNKLFLSFLWLVFFVKKHLIIIVVAGIIGFTYGFFKEKRDKLLYKSGTVIKQNYKTGENLYRAIDYSNELIEEKDSVTLGRILNIEPRKAASLIGLEVVPISTKNEKLEDFNEYLKDLDSTSASIATFQSYVNNRKKFDYPVQQIIVTAKDKSVFKSVVPEIVKKITATEYFIVEQKKDLLELSSLENSIIKSLEVSAELQNVYKKVLEAPLDKNKGSQTNITIDNTEGESISKEFELYNNDIILRRELVSIQREKEDKKFIIEIVSTQENQGTVDKTKKLLGRAFSFKIYYTLVLVLLVFVVLLGFRFMKLLENYKTKIQ